MFRCNARKGYASQRNQWRSRSEQHKCRNLEGQEHRMITRRNIVLGAGFIALSTAIDAKAAPATVFSSSAFEAAQAAEKPILIVIHATWCPTCKAQEPILSSLLATPKFQAMVPLSVDFDAQKPAVRDFKAQMQSTLIVYRGRTERGRSVGDTNAASIEALLAKAL
jgi:thioredoxin 1